MDLAALHDLALAVAPELSAQPLYVLRHPAEHPAPTGVAYAVADYCPLIHEALAARNLWRGPGPAVVFVQEPVSDEQAAAILIHELAHLLPAKPLEVATFTPAERAERLELVAEWSRVGDESPGVPRWFAKHDRKFTRIALHLWWRAALVANVVVPLDGLCAGRQYDLSPAALYWRAIGNEPLRMRDATFAEIVAADEPLLFSDFWRADLAAWMERNPEHVAKVRQK